MDSFKKKIFVQQTTGIFKPASQTQVKMAKVDHRNQVMPGQDPYRAVWQQGEDVEGRGPRKRWEVAVLARPALWPRTCSFSISIHSESLQESKRGWKALEGE